MHKGGCDLIKERNKSQSPCRQYRNKKVLTEDRILARFTDMKNKKGISDIKPKIPFLLSQ